MARSTRRGPWLPEEDAILLSLVRTQGPNNWVRISQHMQHRSPKQCRERYHQNLKPSLNHEPITPDEGELIEVLVQEMGKRWAEIARRLGNRSDNAVKNWWNGSMNRRRRTSPHATRGIGSRHHGLAETNPYVPLERLQFSPSEPPRQTPDQYQAYHSIERGRGYFDGAPVSPLRSIPMDGKDERQGYPQHYFPPIEPSLAMSPHYPQLPTPVSMQPSPASFPQPGHHPSQMVPKPMLPSISRTHSQQEWPFARPDSSLVSPVPTDMSHSYQVPQPPSLVSDNRSSFSISPKTVTSPKPASPTANDQWRDMESRKDISTLAYGHPVEQPAVTYATQGSTLTFPHQPTGYSRIPHFNLDPALRRPLSAPTVHEKRGERIEVDSPFSAQYDSTTTPPAERDARMNVSRLLD